MSMRACLVPLTMFFMILGFSPFGLADEAVKVIFDTDLSTDVDDVGAVAVLHRLADLGEAHIVAMGVSSNEPHSAACLDALNTYFGRPNVPIGAPKGKALDEKSKYTEAIAKEFSHDLISTADAPDVVDVYRETLAAQPDGSVVLITVGFLTNVKSLLESKPDRHSPLDGPELVRRKVKQWVCMGGRFPSGKEWNLRRDVEASIFAVNHWPTPITFSGYEIGSKIKTGAGLRDLPANSPVRRGYELYNELNDRESWDQTAVLFAVRGPGKIWDVATPGRIVMRPDGSNEWRGIPDGNHSYLIEREKPAEVATQIESLMRAVSKRTQ